MRTFTDHAGQVHAKKYGKSDKLNSPQNSSLEFEEGYCVGASSMRYNARQVIQEEWNLRLECGDDLCEKYDEWERGFWGGQEPVHSLCAEEPQDAGRPVLWRQGGQVRKIIQIATVQLGSVMAIYALCDDGSVWVNAGFGWNSLDPIPQKEEDK